MKYNSKSSLKTKLKPPTYAMEFAFVTVSLFFVKLLSAEAFMAVSFFTICLPIMLYLVITLFGNLLSFIQMMHIEDESSEEGFLGVLSAKQTRLLLKVIMNLMGYFGLYFLTGQLDLYILAHDQMGEQIQIMPAAVGIETAMVIMLWGNY